MNCLDDHNYYDHGGYPASGLSQQEEALRSSSSNGFSAKKDFSGESPQPAREQRPTKFPVKNELDVILRKVRSVLNKISALNYSTLQQRWLNLIPSETETVTEILHLLVAKAMNDPMYMQIYARLANDVLTANPSIASVLRSALSNQIHHALQNLTTDMELAKHGRSDRGREDSARQKRVMLYRFIAELFVENVCSTKFVTERITDLIGQGKLIPPDMDADEPLECICVLLMFAGSKLEEYKGAWLNDVFIRLRLTDTEGSRLPKVSKRMQFMLQDLIEMRNSGWTPQTKWWVMRVPSIDTAVNNNVEPSEVEANVGLGEHKNRRGKKHHTTSKKSRERTLRAILNQVVPSNMERMASRFGQILQKRRSISDAWVENVVVHMLQNPDPMYVRVQSTLLSKVCFGCTHFKTKLTAQLFKYVKEYPESVPLIRFCAELYILGVVSLGEIISILQKNPATGIESTCVFFHRAQIKLFRDWRKVKRFEKMKIDSLIDNITEKAQQTVGNRMKSMVLDIIELRRNNWELIRPLRWSPISLSTRNLSFTVENAINIFNFNEEDGLEFMQENLGTDRAQIEKFVETMCVWAIWRGDITFLTRCGRYIKSIMEIGLLTTKRLQPILGSLVQTVIVMQGKPDAWNQLGLIMRELYNP